MKKRILWMLPVAAAAAAAAVAVAEPPSGPSLTGVPTANTKSPGYAPASRLSPELAQIAVAQGATPVENPNAQIAYYGYDSDRVDAGSGQPLMVPLTGAPTVEAHKTEPDKNTYLVFKDGLRGADANYDYGTHFLFQGHESGTPGYITRINLDADAAHRVTLLATVPTGDIDGSTWDPWAQRLLFTTENSSAPTYAATPDYPSTITDLSGSLGRGGYEGIQNDSDGNIWIVEDIGGANKPGTVAKIPNSFVYRFVPETPGDLVHGELQVLQVLNGSNQPITQATQTALNSADQIALHTYGATFKTRWITIHDTAVSSTAFNANTLAKASDGTPFKRRRTASSARARSSPSSTSTRRATRTRRASRTRSAAGAPSSSSRSRARRRTAARCRSSSRPTSRPPASTTSRSCRRTSSPSCRTPGTVCTARRTHSTPAGSST